MLLHLAINFHYRRGILPVLVLWRGLCGIVIFSTDVIRVECVLMQFEQLSNALALEQLSKGTVMDNLDQLQLKEWLALPSIEASHYLNVAKAIVQWLSLGEWDKTDDLVNDLWS